MNTKKFLMALVAAYVFYHASGFLIHGIWLDPIYQDHAAVFRPKEQMNEMMWIFWVTSALTVTLFCFIFTRGREDRGVGEGARFGLYMGLFLMPVQAYDSYVIYPLPYELAMKWFISGMIVFVVMGMIVSLIYKPEDG